MISEEDGSEPGALLSVPVHAAPTFLVAQVADLAIFSWRARPQSAAEPVRRSIHASPVCTAVLSAAMALASGVDWAAWIATTAG